MGNIDIVVGGQFGSEAKGHVVAALAARTKASLTVRVAGPNAGHSAVDPLTGITWALRQIPCAAVIDYHGPLVIAAGSEIDEEVLNDEIRRLEAGDIPILNRLYIDSQATMIEPHHKTAESGMTDRLGSTAKGIGAARADRLMRQAPLWGHGHMCDTFGLGQGIDTAKYMQQHLWNEGDVIIEGTQGYGLGLHAGYYPFCTSSDCRAIDFLAMCGLSPWAGYCDTMTTWVTLRTFPIRVAGNSGPMYNELSWEQLGQRSNGHIKEERTTVTKKIRRVGEFDWDLAQEAIRANGGSHVKIALMFADYIDPNIAGADVTKTIYHSRPVMQLIRDIENKFGAPVELVGTGPGTHIWR